MALPAGFQKARLEIEGGKQMECAFNPESYTVSKTNVWTFKPTTGLDLPKAEFGGGLPRRTRLSLLLDVSLAGDGASVKDQSNELLKMMETGGGGGGGGGSVPSFITFRWGSVDLPKSVPVSIQIQYVLFHPNGEPIRALVDLELAQADQASTASSSTANAPTNPHTEAIRGMRSHTVGDGDSLHSIAYGAYGDPFLWRVVAEANGIDDPTRLRRGAQLTIPALDA